MSFPASQAPLPYRFGWAEIVLSTLAVLALTALVFLVSSALANMAAEAIVGSISVEAIMAALKDRKTLGANDSVQLILLVTGVCLYLAAALAIVIIARNPRRMPLRQRVGFFDWQLDRQFWQLLAAALAYAVLSGYALEFVLPEARDWVILPLNPVLLFGHFLLVVALGPFCEELLFRGWVFTSVRTRLGFGASVFLTSALFAAAHYEKTLLYAFVVFPVGLALGFVRERYGSIKASACFHAMYNLFGFVVTYFDLG